MQTWDYAIPGVLDSSSGRGDFCEFMFISRILLMYSYVKISLQELQPFLLRLTEILGSDLMRTELQGALAEMKPHPNCHI